MDLELGAGLSYLRSCAKPGSNAGAIRQETLQPTTTTRKLWKTHPGILQQLHSRNSCPKKGTAFVHLTSVSIPADHILYGMGQALHIDVGWQSHRE